MHVRNWDILDLVQNGFVWHPQPWYGKEEYIDKKKNYAKAAVRVARPSRIVGQGYSLAGKIIISPLNSDWILLIKCGYSLRWDRYALLMQAEFFTLKERSSLAAA